jgi:hypothetical protein
VKGQALSHEKLDAGKQHSNSYDVDLPLSSRAPDQRGELL